VASTLCQVVLESIISLESNSSDDRMLVICIYGKVMVDQMQKGAEVVWDAMSLDVTIRFGESLRINSQLDWMVILRILHNTVVFIIPMMCSDHWWIEKCAHFDQVKENPTWAVLPSMQWTTAWDSVTLLIINIHLFACLICQRKLRENCDIA